MPISQKQLLKLCKEDPQRVINALFEAEYWLPSLNTTERYSRYEDDSPKGSITVAFSQDGDGWLIVISEPDPNDLHMSMRFRTYFGGGQSLKTRKALLILAEAIRQENLERPQHRK